MISKYNEFILENEFNSILNDIFKVVESSGWVDSNKYEWDLKEDDRKDDKFNLDIKTLTSDSMLDKLKKFLEKLPKDKIKRYFIEIMDAIKNIPSVVKRKLILGITGVFLTFTSIGFLMSPSDGNKLSDKQIEEISEILPAVTEVPSKKLNIKSKFVSSQGLVKEIEKGYSKDRSDDGNWVETKKGRRFVGTNHGVSAPVLQEYLGRIPTKKDMINLDYEEAREILRTIYWENTNLEHFSNQSVANLVYDGCVNQGVNKMRSVLRVVLGEFGIDGDVYSIRTIKKANMLDQEKLFNSIMKERKIRYTRCKSYKKHKNGWMNRLEKLIFKE